MSIRLRLTLINTAILTFTLVLFGVAVYVIVRENLNEEVDSNLEAVARHVQAETQAIALDGITILKVPGDLDVFHSASVFIVVLNRHGQVISRSNNLADFERVLDPHGRQETNYYSTVIQDGQTLRVFSVPLRVNGGAGDELIGHLQVAQLLDTYSLGERLRTILLLTGLAAVFLSLFLGVFLINNMLRPLDDMAAVALQITRADDLSRRLPDSGRRDEIGQLTMALNATLERLENLFRAQQRFLADVSHELRTPLTTIRGNVELMRRMGSADPETLDVIQEEVERMTRLVGDLLLLARADTGGLPIRRESVDLDTLFLDVYRQVRLIEPDLEIEMDEVDQVRVLGDEDRLRQLILNLVDNAIKYTPDGGRVQMSLSKADGRAEIRVSDSGIGIPPADLPLIFDRFYRVDKARARAHGGSGLGLSIARWIAQVHGGEINVKSQVGQGSTFTVILPVLPERNRLQQAAGPEVTAAGLRPLGTGR